ncbi:hypothetical protein C8R47DRAFT_1078997 [Mycena vitilis]|nr:hypothetical protein C8R47DRAFT_1078997 [Mycena vitilis]
MYLSRGSDAREAERAEGAGSDEEEDGNALNDGAQIPNRLPKWKAVRKPAAQAMEEEEQLMQAFADAAEDDVPDDGAIEIDSEDEYQDQGPQVKRAGPLNIEEFEPIEDVLVVEAFRQRSQEVPFMEVEGTFPGLGCCSMGYEPCLDTFAVNFNRPGIIIILELEQGIQGRQRQCAQHTAPALYKVSRSSIEDGKVQ